MRSHGEGTKEGARALRRAAAVATVALSLVAISAGLFVDDARAAVAGGPMEKTRSILQSSNRIVTGPGTRDEKLVKLKELLREFLDTDALGRKAMGTHLDGESPENQKRFLELFRGLFVRTYVQRLLLFDAPDFAYGAEKVDGDAATVDTEIVTPRDRFAVDYRLRRDASGWRATDILIEDVSLSANFEAQFDKALKKDSFGGLLDKLERKLRGSQGTTAPPPL